MCPQNKRNLNRSRRELKEHNEEEIVKFLILKRKKLSKYAIEHGINIRRETLNKVLKEMGKEGIAKESQKNRGNQKRYLIEITSKGFFWAHSKGICSVDDFIYGSGLLDRTIGEKTHPTIIDIYRKITPKLCAQINLDYFDQIDIDTLCKKVLSTAIWQTVIASKESDVTNSLYDDAREFLNDIRNKADKAQSIKLTTEIIEHLSHEQTRISEELKVARSLLEVYRTGKIPAPKKKKEIIKRRRI